MRGFVGSAKPPRMRAYVAIALILGLAASACGTARFVGRGVEDYQQGKYTRSIQDFKEIENSTTELNAKGQVRYYVFRGLAHYHLGERDLARDYLKQGSAAYDRGDPRWINPTALAEMRAALADLNGAASAPPAQPVVSAPTSL